MEDCIRIAFLGWREEARCLVENGGGGELHMEILGVVMLPEEEVELPPELPLRRIEGLHGLRRLHAPVCLLDLRPPGSERPKRLPGGVLWVPPEATRLLEHLCQQQAQFRRCGGVVETAQDAVVTIDESHRILFFNRAAEAMFGYSKGEAIGQDLNLIIPTPHRAQHREYVRRYVETRSGRFINHTVDLTAERRSGEEFPISISFSVAAESGHLLMTAIMRDMTQLKNLEQRALQNERLVSVGQALSYVTHEVKNPLIVIGGFARALMRGESIQGEDRRKLDIIVKEVQRLEGLIEEIQDFTKPLRLEKETIHLVPFLRETLALFRGSEASAQVRFSLEAEGDSVVTVDPDRLRQVLLNLVKNAMEAIADKGQVTVRVRENARSVSIEVTDTGEGIPPERLEEIFQPFVTTKRGGSGLGLPLCRKIVRDHGGDMTISSQPGEGTQVKLTFPRAQEA